MKQTTHRLDTSTINKSMAKIMELLPDVCGMVKGHKGDGYDYFLHTKSGKTAGKWSRVTKLAVSLGWADRFGSNLTVIEF